MPVRLDPAAVRAYLARDWAAVRHAKRRYWHARMMRGGLGEALAVTDQLRAWRMRLEPGWPSEDDREEDLQTHQRVAQALNAVAPTPRRARTRRSRAPRLRRRRTP